MGSLREIKTEATKEAAARQNPKFICPRCGCPDVVRITTNVTLSAPVSVIDGEMRCGDDDYITDTEDTEYDYACRGCDYELCYEEHGSTSDEHDALLKWFDGRNNGTQDQAAQYRKNARENEAVSRVSRTLWDIAGNDNGMTVAEIQAECDDLTTEQIQQALIRLDGGSVVCRDGRYTFACWDGRYSYKPDLQWSLAGSTTEGGAWPHLPQNHQFGRGVLNLPTELGHCGGCCSHDKEKE